MSHQTSDYIETPNLFKSRHLLSQKAQVYLKGSLAPLVPPRESPFMRKVDIMKRRGTIKAPPEDEEETEEELL
jgi:hypothetical protein